jgi:hypothetical protein
MVSENPWKNPNNMFKSCASKRFDAIWFWTAWKPKTPDKGLD